MAWVAALWLAVIVVLIVASITARALFNTDIVFSWEYSGYLMSGVFFFGAAHTLRSGTHIRVTLLYTPRFERYARFIEAIATLMTLALALFLTVSMAQFAWESYLQGTRSYTPMQTFLAVPRMIPVIGGVVLAIQLCARFLCTLLGQPAEVPVEDDSGTADK